MAIPQKTHDKATRLVLTGQLEALPTIKGTWYFVNPQTGLSTNNGRSPDTPFDNITTAHTKVLANASRGDGIVLMSSGTTTDHTSYRLSAALDWSVNNCVVIGECAPLRFSHRCRVTPASGTEDLAQLITVSGYNNSFYNIQFFNGGSDAAALNAVAVTGNRNYFQNCHFYGAASATPSAAVGAKDVSIVGGSENRFVQCMFGSDTIDRVGNLASTHIQFDTAAIRNHFEDCDFLVRLSAGNTAFGAIKIEDATGINRDNFFRNCMFCAIDLSQTGSNGQAATVVIGTAPTDGRILMFNCATYGYTNWATAASDAVRVNMPTTAASAGGGISTIR
jgi:hypothetical protein